MFGILFFCLLAGVEGMSSAAGVMGGGGEPPDPNKPFKVHFLDGLDQSPDEEDEELFDQDQVAS